MGRQMRKSCPGSSNASEDMFFLFPGHQDAASSGRKLDLKALPLDNFVLQNTDQSVDCFRIYVGSEKS